MNNYWGEPYPKDMEELIKKSENGLNLLIDRLNDPNCKVLNDLYLKNPKTKKMHCKRNTFKSLGYIPNNTINKAKKPNEIKGLYLYAEVQPNKKIIPCYIGISGSIYRRLKQHGWGKYHNQATFAYLMASNHSNHRGTRTKLHKSKIKEKQEKLKQYKVAILSETLDYDLYFMEVYIAGKLKTKWNTFKTH